MIIKCQYCKKEFDNNKRRKQHEKDAHPEGGVAYYLKEAEKWAAKAAPSNQEREAE